MPALGSRHPEPQGGQSCGLPVIIQIRFCTRPGVRISQTITDYLGAYLVSLHAAILTAPQTGFGQKRSPCAGCMIRTHSFAEPNFNFDLFFVRP